MLQNVNSFVLQDSGKCLKKRSRKVLSELLITQWFWSPEDLVLHTEQSCQKPPKRLRARKKPVGSLFLQYLQSPLTSVAVWSYLVQMGSSELSPEVPNPDYIWTIIRAHLFFGLPHHFVYPLRHCPHFISISATWRFWCCREADFHKALFLNHLMWFIVGPSE